LFQNLARRFVSSIVILSYVNFILLSNPLYAGHFDDEGGQYNITIKRTLGNDNQRQQAGSSEKSLGYKIKLHYQPPAQVVTPDSSAAASAVTTSSNVRQIYTHFISDNKLQDNSTTNALVQLFLGHASYSALTSSFTFLNNLSLDKTGSLFINNLNDLNHSYNFSFTQTQNTKKQAFMSALQAIQHPQHVYLIGNNQFKAVQFNLNHDNAIVHINKDSQVNATTFHLPQGSLNNKGQLNLTQKITGQITHLINESHIKATAGDDLIIDHLINSPTGHLDVSGTLITKQGQNWGMMGNDQLMLQVDDSFDNEGQLKFHELIGQGHFNNYGKLLAQLGNNNRFAHISIKSFANSKNATSGNHGHLKGQQLTFTHDVKTWRHDAGSIVLDRLHLLGSDSSQKWVNQATIEAKYLEIDKINFINQDSLQYPLLIYLFSSFPQQVQ